MANTINLLLDGFGAVIESCDKNKIDIAAFVKVLQDIKGHDLEIKAEKDVIATQRQDAVPKIAEFYRNHPSAKLEPPEVLAEIGLPDTGGNRNFLRNQWKKLELTHNPA